MGMEENVGALEDLLGLNEIEEQAGAGEENGSAATGGKEETSANVSTAAAETTPTVITAEDQSEIVKDIVKIDIELEKLSAQTVDISEFYNNLDTELTEEEQQLEFSDKPAYMKLVNTKVKEYETKHSPTAAIALLQEKRAEAVQTQERQGAILAVVAKYPDFSYETIFDFFDKKMTKEQQDSIYADSKSFQDVYEKVYLKYKESNTTNISQQEAPTLPNVNSVRRQELPSQTVESGMDSEEQRLHSALGI